MSAKPRVLVARMIFPDILDELRRHFDVEVHTQEGPMPYADLLEALKDKDGVHITTSEPIDAALLDACPSLRAVCIMAVGYNNVDVAACTQRGVLVTNTPDVLTDTTADLGFEVIGPSSPTGAPAASISSSNVINSACTSARVRAGPRSSCPISADAGSPMPSWCVVPIRAGANGWSRWSRAGPVKPNPVPTRSNRSCRTGWRATSCPRRWSGSMR